MWTIGYTFDKWKATTGVVASPIAWPSRTVGDYMDGGLGLPVKTAADWPAARAKIRERINWTLGVEPPGLKLPSANESRGNAQQSTGWRGDLFQRPQEEWEFMETDRIQYGDDLSGELYFPRAIRTGNPARVPQGVKIPLVLWLHPYSYAMGYSQYTLWAGLVQAGFAVFCFDQIGFGVRSENSKYFYDRYKEWSLLGKMVTDTRAVIDELVKNRWIDSSRIFVTGYALGGKVALYTAALDERIAGVSVRCAFSPLRPSGDVEPSEGIRHYSHVHGLLPKLGYFTGQPSRIPVDYDEIVASLAPRPALIVAPEMDRYNPVDRVKQSVEASRRAYSLLGAESALEINSVLDFNRWAKFIVQEQWLTRAAGLPVVTA